MVRRCYSAVGPADVPSAKCGASARVADGSCSERRSRRMSRPNGINLRCALVLFRGHSVLLVRRSPNSGGWVLPGGDRRAGESTAACAAREARVGTGLVVDPVRVALVLEGAGPGAGARTI